MFTKFNKQASNLFIAVVILFTFSCNYRSENNDSELEQAIGGPNCVAQKNWYTEKVFFDKEKYQGYVTWLGERWDFMNCKSDAPPAFLHPDYNPPVNKVTCEARYNNNPRNNIARHWVFYMNENRGYLSLWSDKRNEPFNPHEYICYYTLVYRR